MIGISSIRRSGILLAVVTAVLLGGCATRPTDPDDLAYYLETNDPLEPMNRAVFAFNDAADRVVLRPLAIGYRAVTPSGVRAGIRNFLNNLTSPLTLLNALLQGEGVRARDTVGRFMTNTILGLGGFIDVASDAGIPQHYEDFGQTLAVWGMGSGPYLVLPILGPSSFRDGVGEVVDGVADPVGFYTRGEFDWEGAAVRYMVDAVDWRASNLETIDELRRSSLDFYVTVRSGYRQRRAFEIRNGRPPDENATGEPGMIDFNEMDLELEPPPAAAPVEGQANVQ